MRSADALGAVDVRVGMLLLNHRKAFHRELFHLLDGTELECVRRAGLRARRLKDLTCRLVAVRDAVVAEIAFCGFVTDLVNLGNVPRAVVLAVVTADALFLVDDDRAVRIAVNGVLGTALRTGGITAVEAVLLEEVPVELPLVIDALLHFDERIDA